MTRPRGGDRAGDLSATRTEHTLRDTLHELPVDALVPAGWRVGTEVVQFEDRLPADGVTLGHGDYPRDLVITDAGAGEGEALAVHERDRVAGRRTVVAGVPTTGDGRAELEAALRAAGRAAARIETGASGEATVDRAEPSVSLSGDDDRRVNFY
ncbi:hypothetical protein [Halobaculum magnesiiphilum]|uniref:Uncharacterized protein n=1 Tax=Halobaculum magnesiiphilum TaxID=1017351 RepID=A0A8T8WBY1_9EURY|nr:hypothetical protein [Halobaculum magnesiiphilum]QZP37358.1 hypothetical protein K6T50_13915 [Halobaculum magnesiiphilum]